MRVLLVSSFVLAAACLPPQGGQRFTGEVPPNTVVDLAGRFTLSSEGHLVLSLVTPCTILASTAAGTAKVPCGRSRMEQIAVVARTPWDVEVRGAWLTPRQLVFRIDWAATGVDLFAEDVSAMIVRPWQISGATWSPTSDEGKMMLDRIRAATGVETDLVQGGPPPKLAATVDVEGGSLRTGGESTLVVRIVNLGSGTAYRVAASLLSSIDGLDGQRMMFGMIRPGAEKVRKHRVTIPATEKAPDTMLVLAVSEGNGAAPPNTNRRIALTHFVAAPVLALQCAIEGQTAARPDLHVGLRSVVGCTVSNSGEAAEGVELEIAIAGGTPTRSSHKPIAAGERATFEQEITIPRGLPIDATVEIAIVARDRQSSRSVRQTIVGVIRKPRLCVPGQLTRAQYDAKMAELRASRAAGDLTQTQLDRYDAELIACLRRSPRGKAPSRPATAD